MAPLSAAGNVPKKSSPRVLLVDDDPGTLQSMVALLSCEQMRVSAAPSAEDALAVARHECLDLALIDYRLPGITGLELASSFRAEGISVPWVIYSGFLDHEIVLKAGRLGAVNAVSLPFDVDSVVANALERAKVEREGTWRRVREGVRGPKPIRSVARAAWWILTACASRDDLRAIQAWGRCVGESGSVLRREFSRLRIRPSVAQRFMRVLRALAHVDGRIQDVEGELAAGDQETIDALISHAGLHRGSGSSAVTFEDYVRGQRFIPNDHALARAIRELLAES